MARPLLSAGDLLRSAQALGVLDDAAMLQRLARQLGLLLPPAPPAPGPARPPDKAAAGQRPPRVATAKHQQAVQKTNRNDPGPGAGHQADIAPAGSPVQALLQPLPDLPLAPQPGWLLPGAPVLAKGPVQPRTPHDPLFNPASSRAMGAALAAVQVADGDLDAPRLVAALAAGETPRSLPRLPVWTLRHGLQVLVDQGPGMQPWQQDVQQLLALLGRLLGGAQLQVLGFEGEPLQACWQPGADAPGRWPLPPRGAPVLLLSDLGLTRVPGLLQAPVARRWAAFAQAAGRAGTAVRVLVPFAPARWPAALPAPLRPLYWHRRTTVASLRRLLSA